MDKNLHVRPENIGNTLFDIDHNKILTHFLDLWK